MLWSGNNFFKGNVLFRVTQVLGGKPVVREINTAATREHEQAAGRLHRKVAGKRAYAHVKHWADLTRHITADMVREDAGIPLVSDHQTDAEWAAAQARVAMLYADGIARLDMWLNSAIDDVTCLGEFWGMPPLPPQKGV